MGKKVTPLQPNEQLLLRKKARSELLRLEQIISDSDIIRLVDCFKDKFSVCEIVYKVILEDHQFNKTGVHKERLTVSMNEAPHALRYAGYDFDRELLTKLFGAEERIGKRSVKKLRDSLTHSMNEKAIKELDERYEEMNGYMDQFLSVIKDFDSAA